MTVTWLIGGAIAFYAVWVVRRKARDIRSGNSCGCGCRDCPSQCGKRTEE